MTCTLQGISFTIIRRPPWLSGLHASFNGVAISGFDPRVNVDKTNFMYYYGFNTPFLFPIFITKVISH